MKDGYMGENWADLIQSPTTRVYKKKKLKKKKNPTKNFPLLCSGFKCLTSEVVKTKSVQHCSSFHFKGC